MDTTLISDTSFLGKYGYDDRDRFLNLISYEKFRDTKDVRFFDISINESNFRDLVIHRGPAISPPNEGEFNNWQFYIHHNQEDNLLVISGGEHFFALILIGLYFL